MNSCYVYLITNPFTNQPYYVGLSKNNDGQYSRAQYHIKYLYESDKSANPHKYYTTAQILREGGVPTVTIVADQLSIEEACDVEKTLISKYGRSKDGGILTNIGRGGEGNTSNGKAVDQYNLFGEYIQTFETLLDAARFCGKTSSSSIVECCKHRGKSKSYAGYLWAYSGELLDLEWCWANSRPIIATSLGYDQHRYISASAAAKDVNGAPALITKACNNGKVYKQRTWRFMCYSTRS